MKSTRFVLCSGAIALASFFALVRMVEGRDSWQERATAERVSRDGIEERLAAAEEARASELAALKARIGGLESELEKARGAAADTERTNAALVSANAELAKYREALAANPTPDEKWGRMARGEQVLTLIAQSKRENRQIRIRNRVEPMVRMDANIDHRGPMNQGVEYVEPTTETSMLGYVELVDVAVDTPEVNGDLNQGVNYVDQAQAQELVEFLIRSAEQNATKQIESDCKGIKLVEELGKKDHSAAPVVIAPVAQIDK